jgi:uncharacterized membrane protein
MGYPNPLEHFPGDYYKVEGSPDMAVSLERSTVYQDEDTSLFMTLKNRGKILSFKVNEAPTQSMPEEVFAAELELELENGRTTAQDISVSLSLPYPPERRPLEFKREVAYAGTLREGQVSPRLEFPVEVYENSTPGEYTIYATVNYTYQLDVAVKSASSRPRNPDIYYLYESSSQVIPLKLGVERRSGADLKVLGLAPGSFKAGSKENVLKVAVENIGKDTARDVVARLRPESGIYVSVDESPIPRLAPGERSELVYKLDVSKDAVAGKRYMLRLLFEFSDSYRKELTDTESAYLQIEQATPLSWGAGLLVVAAAAVLLLVVIRKRRGAG